MKKKRRTNQSYKYPLAYFVAAVMIIYYRRGFGVVLGMINPP